MRRGAEKPNYEEEMVKVDKMTSAPLQIPVGTVRAAEHAMLRCHVVAVLRHLPENYRKALIMREVHCMKYEEISRALGIPIHSVKTCVKRGRKELREALHQFLMEKTREKK